MNAETPEVLDIVEQADRAVKMSKFQHGLGFAFVREVVPRLLDEVLMWRRMAEDSLGVTTADEVADHLALSELSISLADYGEWGCETLECLFAELGIQPGDDFQQAVERVRAAAAVVGVTGEAT